MKPFTGALSPRGNEKKIWPRSEIRNSHPAGDQGTRAAEKAGPLEPSAGNDTNRSGKACWYRPGGGACLFFFLGCLIILWGAVGCGDPNPKVFRVGVLCALEPLRPALTGFKSKMAELGYIEGRTIVYDTHLTTFDSAKEKRILEKFIADKVDAILVMPSATALIAKRLTKGTDIPVVFCHSTIEGTHLVDNIREPGGNITGVRFPGPDIVLKRFEIMRELVPEAKRVWVAYAKDDLILPVQLAILRRAADKAGIRLVEYEAKSPEDLIAELKTREQKNDVGFDAIFFLSEPYCVSSQVFPTIGRLARKHDIPLCGVPLSMDGYATLFGVVAENVGSGRLAALQMHKVLRGVPAGTIPVVSPEFYFQLNFAEARRLGLKIPEGLLKQATEIIR